MLATEQYNKRLVEEGINQEKLAENLKSLPRRVIVYWIMEAWNEITSDVIKKSFRMYALNLSTDWSEDNMINCFKNEMLCKWL